MPTASDPAASCLERYPIPPPTVRDAAARAMHGASEKRRRDNMNQLVEELRELVPSVDGPPGLEEGHTAPAVPEAKRSKVAVLQDTVTSIKALRERCDAQAAELHALRGDLARMAPPEMSTTPVGRASQPDHGVTVTVCNDGADRWLAVISCGDRRGLLADIMGALRGLSLSVVRAAIVTEADGRVNDVFELHKSSSSPSAPTPTCVDIIRQKLEAAVGDSCAGAAAV